MREISLEEYIDEWQLSHPDWSCLDAFNFGRDFSDLDDMVIKIQEYPDHAINDFLFKLLKSKKVSVSQIIESYTNYLASINNEKSDMVTELAINLMTYRRKIYTSNEIPEVEARADKILKKTNMFNI